MSKYIKEDLEKMLREHTKNQAKLTEVELKKEGYEKKLEYAGTVNEETARSMLIERNLRLVVYIAKKFDNTGIGVEDLISIGTIGLIKAINTFNFSKFISTDS